MGLHGRSTYGTFFDDLCRINHGKYRHVSGFVMAKSISADIKDSWSWHQHSIFKLKNEIPSQLAQIRYNATPNFAWHGWCQACQYCFWHIFYSNVKICIILHFFDRCCQVLGYMCTYKFRVIEYSDTVRSVSSGQTVCHVIPDSCCLGAAACKVYQTYKILYSHSNAKHRRTQGALN